MDRSLSCSRSHTTPRSASNAAPPSRNSGFPFHAFARPSASGLRGSMRFPDSLVPPTSDAYVPAFAPRSSISFLLDGESNRANLSSGPLPKLTLTRLQQLQPQNHHHCHHHHHHHSTESSQHHQEHDQRNQPQHHGEEGDIQIFHGSLRYQVHHNSSRKAPRSPQEVDVKPTESRDVEYVCDNQRGRDQDDRCEYSDARDRVGQDAKEEEEDEEEKANEGDDEDRQQPFRHKKQCRAKNCHNKAVDHGVCGRHGGGKRCLVENCGSRVQRFGLCWKHGGYRICSHEGCRNRAKARGLCVRHGGVDKCSVESCTTTAVSNGLCWAHGGGQRCLVQGCRRLAYKNKANHCLHHYDLLIRFRGIHLQMQPTNDALRPNVGERQ